MDTENHTRDRAGMASFPDVMNDPAFDEREKGFEELDTCRICHGEASEEEPLFYPCKCSGSIKFVHQMCLVEWLSHSQKKHCELCKTPFRFTKLYDPNMPQSLPTPLFLKQALIQSFRTIVTWLRFVLVAFVWLGWLPWSMRAIWRALFWLADGRWSASDSAQGRVAQVAQTGVGELVLNGTMSSNGVNSMTSTVSNAAMPSASSFPTTQSSFLSFPAGEPLMLTMIKKVIPSLFIPAFTSRGSEGGMGSTNATSSSGKPRYPSWLSDVKFLNSLTPYPTINNMIIDTLEGQLITLLVVIAFILLFLIREWVVQQQPMANIAEGEREAAVQLIANNRPNEDEAPRPELGPARPEDGLDHYQEGQAWDEDGRIPRSSTQSPAPSWRTDSDDGLPHFARPPGQIDDQAYRPMDLPDIHYDTFFDNNHDLYPSPRGVAYREAEANGDTEEMLRLIREEVHEAGEKQDLREAESAVANEDVIHPAGPSTAAHGNAEVTESVGAIDTVQAENENQDRDLLEPREQSATQNPDNELPGMEGAPPADRPEDDQPARGVAERLVDWFWGDITPVEHDGEEPVPEDDEHIVQDPALEDPFVPLQNRVEDDAADAGMQAAPGDAGLDAGDMDAIEGDDFEGIMDLIGMQGPIFGLFQNGVFCALLIAFTVAIGIWLPYLWGKIALVLLANPIELIIGVPMTAVTIVADVAVDTLIGVLGYVMYSVSLFCKVLLSPLGAFVPIVDWIPQSKSVTSASLSLIDASTLRLAKVVKAFLAFHESDIPMFSVLSHRALKLHQARLITLFSWIFAATKFILHDFPLRLVTRGIPGALSFDLDLSQLKSVLVQVQHELSRIADSPLFTKSVSQFINASATKAATTPSVNYDLAVWDTKDRVIAIFMGYLLASAIGLLYLRITGLLAGANRGQRIDGLVAEVLLQAGGVMKVILIIGIEMIVFPLYCGTLLDLALLPLFSNATAASRLAFTGASPLTSLFVHWFIGTCYMFHFALFVSMCRKILRGGVLYFIRDPDDPTFHPIRDVLERSITTQLRKIGFSAMVYGALVIVCLGGVVWGLHFALDGVLPIHWSASAPMLEFPVDLLFYNFIMPLAIQSVKPSDGLHDLYDWWFHKCAHFLRLSNFLFSERVLEEEGRHVRRTWWGVLSGAQGDWVLPVMGEDHRVATENENHDAYFLRDGRYVRAPASDQVRIPKGTRVFLEVTEGNERIDGKPDRTDGLHGRHSNMFTKVYIPPFFRTRIAAFILLIWLFAATTGVGITIIPLVIGRRIVSSVFSSPVPVNDVYAFSSGLCVVGALTYVVCYCRTALHLAREHLGTHLQSPLQAAHACIGLMMDAARLLYLLSASVVLLPSLFALLTELYILIPVHTFFGDGQSHVVHIVQDWALGVLYVQMAIKLILWNPHSWAAAAVNGIFRDGWLKPNVGLATRALILPLSLLTTAAVVLPLSFGFVVRWAVFFSRPEVQPDVYRYAYPATLLLVLAVCTVHLVLRRVAVWRVNIRDDVYLIGERLHNFSARDVGVSRRVITG
ncbi:hypothetical protein NUU61_008734 [Penicillium alfredii]|uniref:RING-type E3 ubiquitin transferase n=1 Tax=Penicillium alfredii TaxID=1506179 RepID=A0A9W9ELY2_9EURO|nr:uncharacterized protein NUU61_008734 [Penicillium alfredii]KAJ5084155.1 hypothetical protein NUU61_008734 [Penicillium alfredii]